MSAESQHRVSYGMACIEVIADLHVATCGKSSRSGSNRV